MTQSLGPYPAQTPIGTYRNERGLIVPIRLHPMFDTWMQNLGRVVSPIGTNGATSARPVGSPQQPLYVGQDYFDTTLGYKVTIKSLNPTVWVNGAGAVV